MSDPQHITDSDDENSLPPLLASSVDINLLKEFYSFLSRGSKSRLRAEAARTSFDRLYAQFDNDMDVVEEHAAPEHISSGDVGESDTSICSVDAQGAKGFRGLSHFESGLGKEDDTMNQLNANSQHKTQVSPKKKDSFTPIKSNDQRPSNSRSLRKRNFSSRHPYIADQADWLGICTIDGINEMFTAEEDITKVLKALNSLYTKKKKRYPDEDRYKAKSFYAHLGENNRLALQGDSNSHTSSNIGDGLEADIEDDSHSLESQIVPDVENDESEELIPFEDLTLSPKPPNLVQGDSGSETEHVNAEMQHSVQSSEEVSEEEFIKVGGKYRKLRTILRGVLPESAKRLNFFQEKHKAKKKRRHLHLEIEPRKGLAIRKQAPTSKESLPYPMNLTKFVSDENFTEEYSPNHLNIKGLHHYDPKFAESFSAVSKSDPESDSIEEVLERSAAQSFDLDDSFSLYSAINSNGDSDSVEEDDRIDPMFAPKGRSKGSKTRNMKRLKRSSPFIGNSSKLPNRGITEHKYSWGNSSRTGTKAVGKLRRKKNPLLCQYLEAKTALGGKKKEDAPTREIQFGQKNKFVSTEARYKRQDNLLKENETNRFEHDNSNCDEPKRIQFFLPINPPHRRSPTKSTTVYEVESETKYVKTRPPKSAFFSPDFAMPSNTNTFCNSLTPFSSVNELERLHTIGDGHIFFMRENEIDILLVGQRFSFGLYKLNSSTKELERFLHHLRKTLCDLDQIRSQLIRDDMKRALVGLSKWMLIVRESVPNSVKRDIRLILRDLTKLHTREIRRFQSVFHAQLLFVLFIIIKLGPREKEIDEFEVFDTNCLEFWSIFFLAFTIDDINIKNSNSESVFESIKLLRFVYGSRDCSWWTPIIGALNECGSLNENKTPFLDISYLLASLHPQDPPNWGAFFTIFDKLKSENLSRNHLHFLDICDLAIRKLSWPFDERLVTHVYASLGMRKFGNFADEKAVPEALQYVYSKHDIPNTTVFDRFLCLVYEYVTQLLSQKTVKKLISKLVASSQYQYQKGRRFQIMFVNRVNLILLLYQVSDSELKNQLTNLIEQIRNSKDMFVYGRAVDALHLFCEIGKRQKKSLPWASFQILLESFRLNYASLFGMPNLFQKTVNLLGLQLLSLNKTSEILNALRLHAFIDNETFPVSMLRDVMMNLANFFFSAVRIIKPHFSDAEMESLVEFQKFFVNFLSNVMKRLPIANTQERNQTDVIIEFAIQIWIEICKLTGSYSWNIIMLQKYSYLGNQSLRERYALFLCLQFMKDETMISKFEVNEVDLIALKGLCIPQLSPYICDLLNLLSQQKDSVFNGNKINVGVFQSASHIATNRAQLISLIVQSVCSSSSHAHERKEYLLALVGKLRDLHSTHFEDANFVHLCRGTIDVILRFTKMTHNDFDEIWEFASTLGFPRKKKDDSWIKYNDQEKLQIANNAFLDALKYDRNYQAILDDLLTADDTHILYTLIELYIEGVKINGTYWSHLAHLLKYVLSKLERFQISVQDLNFKTFLDLLCDVSIISCRKKNNSHIMYELEALTTSAFIIHQAFYIYQGYKEKIDIFVIADKFLAKLNDPDNKFEPRGLFASAPFKVLIGVSHRNFKPRLEQTEGAYEKAIVDQNNVFLCLRRMLEGFGKGTAINTLDDFHFII